MIWQRKPFSAMGVRTLRRTSESFCQGSETPASPAGRPCRKPQIAVHAHLDKAGLSDTGVKTFYFDIGRGEPVIFFQGGGAGAFTYRRHLELLSRKYRIIAPDLPCFGDADAPETAWGFDNYGEYFSAFIESLNLDSVAVVGHSFGGGVALSVAEKSPKVTRLILVNSAGLAPRYSFFGFSLRICRGVIQDFFLFKKSAVLSVLKDFLIVTGKKIFHLPIVLATVKKALWENSLKAYSDRITATTLILWGKDDWLYPLAFAEAFRKAIPGSKLTLIDGPHCQFLYRPEEAVEAVEEFLETN